MRFIVEPVKIIIMVEEIKSILRMNNLALAGLKSHYIKDSQISSSGYYANLESHGPQHGRLDSNSGVGGWAAAEADKNAYQWIQVDLYKPREIFGVMIQGRSQIQQWVTKFKIQYGDSENSLQYVEVGGKPLVFDGATDPQTAYSRRFPKPVRARIFRIVVADFFVHPCLRCDLLLL